MEIQKIVFLANTPELQDKVLMFLKEQNQSINRNISSYPFLRNFEKYPYLAYNKYSMEWISLNIIDVRGSTKISTLKEVKEWIQQNKAVDINTLNK